MEDRKEENTLKEDVTLMTATDLHYLSKELYDPQSEIFARLLENNDGKLIEGGPDILNALKEETLKVRPDALLLSGDLTFNGELTSLKEMVPVLEEIEKAGIDVLVMSGNHDILYPYAATYFGDALGMTESISPDLFRKNLAAFGFDEAIYKDELTLSYAYRIRDDLWILALDGNDPKYPCMIPAQTLKWAEYVLQEAQKEHARVIVMSHQNVLKQNEMMFNGYVLNNHEEVEALLKKYGVSLVLSGHSHLQHTSVDGSLTDVCTESAALYPLPYALVTIQQGKEGFAYERRHLDILQKESLERFEDNVIRMVQKTIEEVSSDSLERAMLRDFAVKINTAYFSGDIDTVRAMGSSEERKLFQEKVKATFWGYYIERIFTEYCD
ncbi:MAG: metallophosphoesterase [Solobacterium sp.]|nr:metallophosphoesterase [Solobacterium sp.]